MERFCQSYIPYNPDSEHFKFVVECSKKAVSHLHSLGHSVVLYTNSDGARLFADCKYDNIFVITNDEKISGREFFAGVKFIAYEKEPLSTIFIDNDVIITKNDCIKKVLSLKCDIVCQQSDIDYIGYIRPREFLLPAIKDSLKIDRLMSVSNSGLNCGLVKFNNEVLKQKYISDRKILIDLITKNNIFQRLKNDETFSWEIFVEQWYLRNLCIVEKFKFLTLDKPNGGQFIDDLGYYHFINLGAKNVQYLNEIYESRINPKEQNEAAV